MIFITGDKHGDFFGKDFNLKNFCLKFNTTKKDILIILGDAGINYYVKSIEHKDNIKYENSKSILKFKQKLEELPITLFCIHGNHEARPETIKGYKTKVWNNGLVYYEDAYPSLLFAKDGESYILNKKKVLVVGGAYSIDKEYRLAMNASGLSNYKWFDDEQISISMQEKILEENKGKHYDVILSHTCPISYEPTEVFLTGISQDNVDKSMEKFLEKLKKELSFDKWYCGHYHTNKKIDNFIFMFHSLENL